MNLLKFFALIITGTLFISSAPAQKPSETSEFIVVLDAGHGGQDPGNSWNGFSEKNIALNLVLRVGAELEKLPNVKVLYTRKTDEFVTLAGRANIANKAEADLFISVHLNGHKSQAQGTETFVLGLHRNQDNLEVAMRENQVIYLEENYEVTYDGFDPKSPESYIGITLMQEEYLDQSILLASFIQKNFTNINKRVNRGVKQAGFLVLRETFMPSVLVEAGFLSNKSEGTYLNSERGKADISESIVQAVKNYKNSINLEILDPQTEEIPAAVVTNTIENFDDIFNGITFKVQLVASSKKLEPKSSNFKGLTPVFREKEGKLFKYYYGATSSYSQINKLHLEAQKNGYPSSYVIAFKAGKKITVNEALKTQSK